MGYLQLLQGMLSIYSGGQQAGAIWKAADQRTTQIAVQKGEELTQNAQRAVEQRAAMRAAAAESGVSLSSGSFLAELQASSAQQGQAAGTIQYNNDIEQQDVWQQARTQGKAAQWQGLLGGLQAGGSAYKSFTS